jgi:intraflagellar transport protein 122
VLSVVEFEIASDITDEEALGLIGSRPSHSAGKNRKRTSLSAKGGSNKWKEEIQEDANVQVLHFDDEQEQEQEQESVSLTDPFSRPGQMGGAMGDRTEANKVVLGRVELRSLDPTEVIVCKWPPPLRYKFYKNLLQESMSISTCHKCFKVRKVCS